MAPQFLYTTLAVNKVNGHGLINTAHRAACRRKWVIATVELPGGTN